MGGFGSLKAMNDSIKLNREMLKANKKKPFDRNSITVRSKSSSLVETTFDEAAIKLVRASALLESKKDLRRRIILLVITSLIIVGMGAWILSQPI